MAASFIFKRKPLHPYQLGTHDAHDEPTNPALNREDLNHVIATMSANTSIQVSYVLPTIGAPSGMPDSTSNHGASLMPIAPNIEGLPLFQLHYSINFFYAF